MSNGEFCKHFAENLEKLARTGKENAEKLRSIPVEELCPFLKSKMERDWELTKEERKSEN